MQIIITEMLLK